MTDIELVIKIPEEVKNRLCFGITYPKDIQVVCEALNDCILLPKEHGRLIDADKLISSFPNYDGVSDVAKTIDYAPTIIEADKAESEDKEWNTNV